LKKPWGMRQPWASGEQALLLEIGKVLPSSPRSPSFVSLMWAVFLTSNTPVSCRHSSWRPPLHRTLESDQLHRQPWLGISEPQQSHAVKLGRHRILRPGSLKQPSLVVAHGSAPTANRLLKYAQCHCCKNKSQRT
jgi:hypothetical protein